LKALAVKGLGAGPYFINNKKPVLYFTVKVTTVLGSIPASSDTVEFWRRQMKQCRTQYIKNPPTVLVLVS
jgi:hypothetical protein